MAAKVANLDKHQASCLEQGKLVKIMLILAFSGDLAVFEMAASMAKNDFYLDETTMQTSKCTCDNNVANFQQNSYLSVSEQHEPCKGSCCSLTDR